MDRIRLWGIVWCLSMILAAPAATQDDPSLAPLRSVLPEGKTISVDLQNASLQTVLRSFSEVGGVNIIAGPEVKGRASVTLKDIDWATGLGLVLRAHGLAAVDEGGVLRVDTVQGMANQELSQQSVDRRREELLPLETRLIPLVYGNGEDMKAPLQRMLSPRGTIEVDLRTNTLLLVDIAPAIARIEDMVARLDRFTQQVEIVAKLIDADAATIKDLGITWEATGLSRDGIDATGEIEVNTGLAQPAGSVRVTTFAADGSLDAILDFLARHQAAKIISNPRITTVDNQEARIIVGKKIPLVVTDEAGNAITQLTTIGIKMSVTPHINSDDWVTLDLRPEVSDLSAQATVQGGIIIVTAEASTRVRVRDGDTAMIAGLIRHNETEFITGLPVLKDIPLLGHLFRSTSNTTEERELIITVTPRIIRQG